VPKTVADRAGPVSDYVERSFEAFMVDEYAHALAFARATTGSWSEAEDLTQEAFLAAYRRWDDVSSYERPGAFVRRVIANQQVSGVRRRVREASALDRAVREEATDAEVADPDFWRAVRRLPLRQRQVVALHYLDDRSVADIAVVLDIAEGTVKAHLHAARHALGRQLGNEIEEEEA
jgi:RNA polymerase sigma-70 factor, ECF subfamily